jgi:hypothetical protein
MARRTRAQAAAAIDANGVEARRALTGAGPSKERQEARAKGKRFTGAKTPWGKRSALLIQAKTSSKEREALIEKAAAIAPLTAKELRIFAKV